VQGRGGGGWVYENQERVEPVGGMGGGGGLGFGGGRGGVGGGDLQKRPEASGSFDANKL